MIVTKAFDKHSKLVSNNPLNGDIQMPDKPKYDNSNEAPFWKININDGPGPLGETMLIDEPLFQGHATLWARADVKEALTQGKPMPTRNKGEAPLFKVTFAEKAYRDTRNEGREAAAEAAKNILIAHWDSEGADRKDQLSSTAIDWAMKEVQMNDPRWFGPKMAEQAKKISKK